MDYATAEECRHRLIASYFSDSVEACGDRCDNCKDSSAPKTDITVPAQKFLSCLYKTGERFGATYISEVLCGDEKEKIISNAHDKLSVFGIGKELSKSTWSTISKRLIELGAIEPDEYKALKITPIGADILRGKMAVHIRADRLLTKKAVVKTKHSDLHTPKFFEDFKALRASIAKEHRIPAYIVFGDKTLYELAEQLPSTKEEILGVSGIGEVKFERYGEAFLNLSHELREKENI
jgi:ATP-dependent DNA helicase RecQ